MVREVCSVISAELHLICVSYLHGSGKSQEAVVDPDCGRVLVLQRHCAKRVRSGSSESDASSDNTGNH